MSNFNIRAIRRLVPSFVTAAAIAAGVVMASAQDWPVRPILVISPFPAGAANDIVARLVLDRVSEQIGQPFVVENRPGGGGIVGVASVVRAVPDGYTMLLSSASMSSAVILHRTLPYDALTDLAPIAMFNLQPSVLVSAPGKGFKTVADLVAAAKAAPGALNFASAGVGSASHIAGERFRLAAGIDVQHVPYRGPTEALADLMTGRIDFYFVPLAPALPIVEQGKVTPLAVSTTKRTPSLPNVPTIVEAGYPDATYLFWGGISAPAKTPRAVVERLNLAVDKALAAPGMAEKIERLGAEPLPMTPEQYGKFFADDVAAMIKLARDANIEPVD